MPDTDRNSGFPGDDVTAIYMAVDPSIPDSEVKLRNAVPPRTVDVAAAPATDALPGWQIRDESRAAIANTAPVLTPDSTTSTESQEHNEKIDTSILLREVKIKASLLLADTMKIGADFVKCLDNADIVRDEMLFVFRNLSNEIQNKHRKEFNSLIKELFRIENRGNMLALQLWCSSARRLAEKMSTEI